ncbi:MAG TPA: EAL domain-containing protein, partial [Thiohalobacter sp.]|nr:EAL domain-containing protein [Thiohalobacter sp.]
RTRLILLVGFSLLPAVLLISYNAWQARDVALDQAHADAEQLVKQAVSGQAEQISSARQLLATLAELPEIRHDNPDCQPLLDRLLALHPRYLNLGVIALDGSVPCSALPLEGGVDLSDRSYFRRALERDDFAIGDYQVGRITGKPSVNFGYPVTDDAGSTQAVIFSALDLGWLGQLLAEQPLPPGSGVVLSDSQGTALARYPPGQEPPPAGAAGEWISYAKPLSPGLRDSARIEVRIPQRAIFAPIHHRFTRDLGVIGIAALLVMGVAWLGGESLILRRVDALSKAAKRLGGGDLRARTGLAAGKDELGRLAGTFDKMAAGLERREHALQAAAAELRTVNRALRTLSAGNRALLRAGDEPWLLNEVCRVVVEIGEYPGAWIAYWDPERSPSLQPAAQAGTLEEQSFSGTVLESPASLLSGAEPQTLALSGARPVLLLPLVSGSQETLGLLVIQAATQAGFDAAETELLSETAQDLAFGLCTLRLQQRESQARATIEQMEWYEPLTGLPNRAHLYRELARLLEPGAENQQPLALLLLDLDRFRDINTALGYTQGDRILQAIGPRMRSALPGSALVAHLGEDEFAAVLPDTDTGAALAAGQRLLSALEAPISLEGLPLDVSGSLGIAVSPGHGADPDSLLRAADAALDRAKLERRNAVVYSPERDEVRPERLALAAELRRAIEAGQLKLFCQPKIDLRQQAVSSVEALLRWHHPHRGEISPGEFIPLAESTGLIGVITDWVLEAAARQYHQWANEGLTMPVAANLSARNLLEPGLVPRVEALLTTWGIPTGHLILELTESALMQQPEQALETLQQLRDLGVCLYIDDFGTGYSSLSYLQKLPIDAIKIDKSFVMHMARDDDSYRIVESTIALAHKLGKRVVAEGVEDADSLELLGELRCDAVQGFYISRPMAVDQLHHWLTAEGHKWAGELLRSSRQEYHTDGGVR